METKKVNEQQIAKAAMLRAGSDSTQFKAQSVSPAVRGGAQFAQINRNTDGTLSQAANLLPNAPNYGAQGVTNLYAPLKEDWFWNNWMNNAKKNGMVNTGGAVEAGTLPNLGKVILPESFWGWAKAKQEQAFQEDFNRFVFSQVNVSTPEARAYWEKKFPGYTQQVYDAWALKMQVEAKMAEIQIKGYQNEMDLWFAYQYQNGYFNRMLAPPVNRLVPVQYDTPATLATNPLSENPSTQSMPSIP